MKNHKRDESREKQGKCFGLVDHFQWQANNARTSWCNAKVLKLLPIIHFTVQYKNIHYHNVPNESIMKDLIPIMHLYVYCNLNHYWFLSFCRREAGVDPVAGEDWFRSQAADAAELLQPTRATQRLSGWVATSTKQTHHASNEPKQQMSVIWMSMFICRCAEGAGALESSWLPAHARALPAA